MEPDTTDAWSDYWKGGRSASCFEGPDTEVRLTRVWNEFVDSFRDGAHFLDLATGNGAVVRICAAHAHARGIGLHIDAVDAAAIDPARYLADPSPSFEGVRFQGNVKLENLPFPDGRYDAVASQFGFEYASEELAVTETARVLATAGRLRLVLHAREGKVSHDIGRRVERLRIALADDGPITLVRTLVRAAEAGDAGALSCAASQLPSAVETARRLVSEAPPDDAALYYSREFLQLWNRRDRYWPADLRHSIEEGWTNANGVAIRQAQMLRVARSSDDMKRIGSRFSDAGLVVDRLRELRDEQRNMQIAWLMDAHKPSGS